MLFGTVIGKITEISKGKNCKHNIAAEIKLYYSIKRACQCY